MSETILNFFLKFVDEVIKSEYRNFFLSTQFFKLFGYQCNFAAIKNFTSEFVGKGQTIFELFDRIIIPVKLNRYEYVGVIFDLS